MIHWIKTNNNVNIGFIFSGWSCCTWIVYRVKGILNEVMNTSVILEYYCDAVYVKGDEQNWIKNKTIETVNED